MADKYWLLKAEPDSRVVKGKDVKFSVDDFESVKTSPWEGVRNYEARNLMKEMKVDEKALFYHSNCKNPGVAAFAKVSKEAYPDYTAWDTSHPYFDVKSDSENPKWFMIDLTFDSRAEHFVSLALLRYIADSASLPPEVEYIGDDGFQALKTMDLVRRGRLSVQRVEPAAWEAITKMASKGGWEELDLKAKPAGKKAAPKPKASAATNKKEAPAKKKAPPRGKAKKAAPKEEKEDEESELSELTEEEEDSEEEKKKRKAPKGGKKGKRSKAEEEEESYQDSDENVGRRTTRSAGKRKARDDDGEYRSPSRSKRKR